MDLQEWVKKCLEKLRSFGIKQWGMVLIVGLCCLIIVFPTEKAAVNQNGIKEENGQEEGMNADKEKEEYESKLEERLEELLTGVKDVGKVKVMVTVNCSVRQNVLQDGSRELEQNTETDSAGGSRNFVSERNEENTVFYDIDGRSVPYILSETYPEIMGVVVIAEGSGTGTVDLEILEAVQVLFDVPAHKIKIMKMK